MPRPVSISLIIVFLAHFFVFLIMGLRKKNNQYFCLTCVFLLLTIYLVLRLWWPDFMLFGHSAYVYFRIAAWFFSAMAMFWYVRHRIAASKDP